MQESSSHIRQILLRSLNKSMCKRVQQCKQVQRLQTSTTSANEYNSFVCLTFENYNSIKSQLPKVRVISVIKGCFVKVIHFAWMV